jgi:ligand-binding SRPBCC domain-containing protein
MARSGELEVRSRVNAPASRVWERVTSPEGINGELMPIVRMTAPRELRELKAADVVPGERLCRSWILLFGLIPIDYDDVTPVRIDPERGFLERSQMLTQRLWEHERTLEPDGAGTVVTDRVRFEPRLPIPAGALLPVFRFVFHHRHRRLRRYFGGSAA